MLLHTVGAVSKPSEQHLLVRAQSENKQMERRLSRHKSGAFDPRDVGNVGSEKWQRSEPRS